MSNVLQLLAVLDKEKEKPNKILQEMGQMRDSRRF
jgi:hypothetical protein